MEPQKPLKLLLTVFLLLAISALGFYFYAKKNKAHQDTLTVTSEQKYNEANSLLNERRFDEAEALFTALEKDNQNSMYNLAHLKLKKLQITLFEGKDYPKAVRELELILNNPQFPRIIKSRAAENVFTYYFSSNQNEDFYKAIFTSPTFSPLVGPSVSQSLYNYAEFGYNLYPTTIFGASVIYGKLEKLNRTNIENVATLTKFVNDFFVNSDLELANLGQFENQEVTLINIYTERARVLHKTSRITGKLDASTGIEENLYQALAKAQTLKNPFYIFYTTYNYIDYVANSVISARQEAQSIITDSTIFDKNNVPEIWYRSTIRNVSAWTTSRRDSIAKINPVLGKLIEYNK